MTDEGDMDRRLAELEEVLDREAAAARRAVETPAVDPEAGGAVVAREESPAPAPGPGLGLTILKLAGLGVAAIVGLKIAVALLLAPVLGAFALAATVLKLAFLGAAVYGAWMLVGKRDDPELLDE